MLFFLVLLICLLLLVGLVLFALTHPYEDKENEHINLTQTYTDEDYYD